MEQNPYEFTIQGGEDFYNFIPQANAEMRKKNKKKKGQPEAELPPGDEDYGLNTAMYLSGSDVQASGHEPSLVPGGDGVVTSTNPPVDRRFSRPPSYHTQSGGPHSPGLYPDLNGGSDLPTEVLMQQSPLSEFKIIETPNVLNQQEFAQPFNINAVPQTNPAMANQQIGPDGTMSVPINLQITMMPPAGLQGQQVPQFQVQPSQTVSFTQPGFAAQPQAQPITVQQPQVQPFTVQQPQVQQVMSPQPPIPPQTTQVPQFQNIPQPPVQTPQQQQVFAISSSSMPVNNPAENHQFHGGFEPISLLNNQPVHVQQPQPPPPPQIMTSWDQVEANFSPLNQPVMPNDPMSGVDAHFVSVPQTFNNVNTVDTSPPMLVTGLEPASYHIPPASFTNFATVDQYWALTSLNNPIVQSVPTRMRNVSANTAMPPINIGRSLRPIYDSSSSIDSSVPRQFGNFRQSQQQRRGIFGQGYY